MKLKLLNKKEEAKGIKSFFWEPETPIKHIPGQYIYVTIPKLNYPDEKGNTRHFTISSSPTEGTDIRFTTRIREQSGFKKTLDELSLGSEIEAEGPNGTFLFNEFESGQHIFIAGGIGITPYRSMIKYNIDKKLEIPMHLIYSSSTPEEIAFKEELTSWVLANPSFLKMDITITKPEESKEKWTGLTGRIDENFISKLVPANQISISTFWLSGPPVMVDALEIALSKFKIASPKLRLEKFTGY